MSKHKLRLIGPILHQGGDDVLWKVRFVAPRVPFFIDSRTCFTTKEKADAFAKKWGGKTIAIEIK